eukprot:CAMPEP_0202687494 /NCGR_PEP_ID=MMETSP1385-20130828/3165_1 /ASSEMBLY_ACC=CAM_ASM_000861 /TAXON_ID=933848 /ORGANISM="Elphidium margaritaceum" /LENGTH=257 /DNA_ID=CAMNT_0049342295 /DNA_START=32 /DNA_END=805 /DNA_ORIENTATION=+
MATEHKEDTGLQAADAVGQATGLKADYSKVSCLEPLNSVFIKQPIRTKELLLECFGCEMSNLYEVLNVDEASKVSYPLFNLKEDSNCCLRQCCGAQRPLTLNARFPEQDDDAPPLFEVEKPYRMGCFCCPATTCAGRNYMDVIVNGVVIGSVREQCLCTCKVRFSIYDENETLLCYLERCACMCECFDVNFNILDADEQDTGATISKVFSGWAVELFTTNDQFKVEFPEMMRTTQRKLLMIAAAMMVEFTFFEKKKK